LKNSSGYEGISGSILKYCTLAITKPLSHICNAPLNQSIYPDELKFAIVKLIYKKGETNDVHNYRPISLTTFAKILGKVMYSRFSQHLNVNQILTLEKFGLKKQ
jgi:hypothetical protein